MPAAGGVTRSAFDGYLEKRRAEPAGAAGSGGAASSRGASKGDGTLPDPAGGEPGIPDIASARGGAAEDSGGGGILHYDD